MTRSVSRWFKWPPATARNAGLAVQQALGGPDRWRAVLLLACVMALDSAGSGVINVAAWAWRNVPGLH